MIISIGNFIGVSGGSSIAAQPTVQSSALFITSIGETSLTFNWTDGNGSSRIVLMKADSVVNSDPVDGTEYTANTIFGSGTQIGSGNYVVKLGSGPVTVTGLTPGTQYYIAVYELNGTGSSINYLQASPATAFEVIPPDDDFLLKFDLTRLSTMFQERSISPGGVPITAVTAETNPVGTIHDLSRACKFLIANGSTTIPTLGADGLLFDGSNDACSVANTNSYLRSMHAVGATYGIRLKLKKAVDGSARLIIGTQGLSGTHHGWVLNQTSGNKLQFFASGGTGQTIINYTSTKSFLIADGIVTIQINIADGANASSIRIGGTTETFTADLTKGSTSNCTNNLYVGGLSSFFSGQFCESIEIVNRVWSSGEMTTYDSQTTARSSVDFGLIKQWGLDFSDPAYNFSDAAGTTQVVNNAVTRLTRNKPTIPADVNNTIDRKMTAASDAAAPVWLSNADGNGHGGVRYDGDGVKIMTYSEDICLELGGACTLLFAFLNDDATNGSHLMSSATNYLVLTGVNYSQGPYFVVHSSIDTILDLVTAQSGVDIVSFKRRGNTSYGANRAGQIAIGPPEQLGNISAPNFGASSQGADWVPHGKLLYIEKYIGYMTDADWLLKIKELRSRFTIPATL